MSPAPPTKLLRVALIQGPKITEDRTFKRRASVSVGQNATNTIVVPASNLPPAFTLFEVVNNQYALVFTAAMEGKVTVNGDDVSLADLRKKGLAKPRRDAFVYPLTDGSKGRVSLGEVSLLFQFVNPPPAPPRTELPPGIRGSFLAGVDRLFLLVLAVSLTLHFSGASYIACQPMPQERELSLEELPDRFVKAMMPVEVKPPPPVPTQGEEVVAKKDEPKKDEPKAAPAGPPATNNAKSRAEMEQKVARSGLLRIIGANSGGGGALSDVLGDSSGVGDVAGALSGAGGVGVATADALAANGPKGGTSGSAAGIGDLGTSGGGDVKLGEKATAQVRGGVSMQTPDVDSTDVDREKLASYVRSRKSAIQQCYERELKRTPTLKGRVVVRFSITPAGSATDIDIEENTLGNDAVASCIRTVIRGWRFPFKPPSEVTVAYPFVFAPAS